MELIKLKVREQRYGAAATTEEIHAIKYSDVKKLTDWLKTDYGNGEIEPGKAVWFDPRVTFPRKKFQSSYPTNKLVGHIDKADILVVDPRKITEHLYIYAYEMKYNSAHDYYESERGGFNPRWYPEPPDISRHYIMYDLAVKVKDLHDTLYQNKSSKIIVDVKNINLGGDNYIDDAAYAKICGLFGSTQDDMKNLAMRLLTAYNYETEKVKIAMILNTHWNDWKRCGNKKQSVETKTLLQSVRRDFPNFDREDVIGQFQFWFKVVLENDDLPQAKCKVKDLIRLHMPGVPEFDIIKR